MITLLNCCVTCNWLLYKPTIVWLLYTSAFVHNDMLCYDCFTNLHCIHEWCTNLLFWHTMLSLLTWPAMLKLLYHPALLLLLYRCAMLWLLYWPALLRLLYYSALLWLLHWCAMLRLLYWPAMITWACVCLCLSLLYCFFREPMSVHILSRYTEEPTAWLESPPIP